MANNIDDCISITSQAVDNATLTVAGLLEIGTWLESFLATVVANVGPDAEVVLGARRSADQAASVLRIAEELLSEVEGLGESLVAQK